MMRSVLDGIVPMPQTAAAPDEEPEIIARKRHGLMSRMRINHFVGKALSHPSFAEPELCVFQDRLRGFYPCIPGQPVLLAACNDLYFRRFAVTLLLSLEQLGESQQVHLHLCSPSQATLQHVERLTGSLRHVPLSWTADRGEMADGLPYRSVYYACARFIVAAALQARSPTPILCIDIDGIANRPVWPAYRRTQASGDVALILRPGETSATRKVLASAVGLNCTTQGLRFTSALGRSLIAILDLRPAYHIDQIAIHYLTRRMTKRGDFTVAAMPQALSDYEFSQDGAIWTAKGWKTKNSSLYLDAKRTIDAQFPDLAVDDERELQSVPLGPTARMTRPSRPDESNV